MLSFFQQTDVVAAIVGAIVGGIIGILASGVSFLISAILRNKGKLTIFTNRSKIEFHERTSRGDYIVTSEINEAEDIEFSIDVDFYNNKVGISPQLAAKLSTKSVPTGEIP